MVLYKYIHTHVRTRILILSKGVLFENESGTNHPIKEQTRNPIKKAKKRITQKQTLRRKVKEKPKKVLRIQFGKCHNCFTEARETHPAKAIGFHPLSDAA